MAHTWCRLSVLQPTSRMPTWCSPTIGEAGNLLHGIEECLRLSAGSLVRPTNVTKCAMPVLLPFVISPLGAPSQVSDQARMLASLPFFKYLIMECTVQLSIYYISHGDQQKWELLPFRCRPDTCCQISSASRHTHFVLNWSEQQSNKWTAYIVKKISILGHNW